MGRRSTKSSPAMGMALPFDTVGITILPGVSLPEWAEPSVDAMMPSAPELIADAECDGQDVPAAPALATPASAAPPSPPAWPSTPAASPVPAQEPAMAEPRYAMAGAAMVGAVAGSTAGYDQPGHPYGAEPSRYPAAPTAGLGTWAPAAPAATDARTLTDPSPAAEPVRPALTAASTESMTQTASTTQTASGEASGPADLATLSPQHVALLSWWADMIATGQVQNPAALAGTEGTSPPPAPEPAAAGTRQRRFPVKAASIALVVAAALGIAAFVAPKVLASDEPVAPPLTGLSMPATVGGLVAITNPTVAADLETLLGFGLRPTGATVTSAFGSTAEGPLSLATMATSMGAPADASGQILTWAGRTGATVAPSLDGVGVNVGITCAEVTAIPDAEPGSFCVWTDSGRRGQTYSVAMSVADAMTLTNRVRGAVTSA